MKKIVITDLDDTIWQWFNMWYESSNNFFNNIAKYCDKDIETLYSDFKKVHQKYHTSEASSQISEVQCLSRKDVEIIENEKLIEGKTIIHKYHSDRLHKLSLYPNVISTLKELKSRNIIIVGFTESNTFYTMKRIKQFGLEEYFDAFYAPIDLGKKDSSLRFYDNDSYLLDNTRIVELEKGTKKPNKDILNLIIGEFRMNPIDAIYIGDKLQKDIQMANEAGVLSVYAAYGDSPHDLRYELLQKVSHWSDEEIEYERLIKNSNSGITIEPNVTINSISEILNIFK